MSIYEDRRFELWAYTVSLGRMLLRSIRRADGTLAPGNVDVRFFGVAYLELPTTLHDLEVSFADPAEIDHVVGRLGRPLGAGENVFALTGGSARYLVVAAGWSVEENEMERMDSGFSNPPAG